MKERKDNLRERGGWCWALFLAFLFFAVVALASYMSAFSNDRKADEGETLRIDGGVQLGEVKACGISLVSSEVTTYDNNVSPQADAESYFTLTATVTPNNALDKTVSWSVRWKNGGSGVASNYVTVSPHSGNNNKAVVRVKNAFGRQIEVVCTSVDNPSVYATVTCDYVKRVTLLTDPVIYGGDIMISSGKAEMNYDSLVMALQPCSTGYYYVVTNHDGFSFLEYGTGTITPEVDIQVQIYPSFSLMQNKNYPFEPSPELHSYCSGQTFSLTENNMKQMLYGDYTMYYLYNAMKEYQQKATGNKALRVNACFISRLPNASGSGYINYNYANYSRDMEANLSILDEWAEGGLF